MRIATALSASLTLATLASSWAAAAEAVAPIKTLIVSGINNHDCEWTAPNLKKILDATGRFDVTITMEAGKTLADAKAIEGVQLFVLDYNGPRWGDAADQNFLKAVSEGAGVAVVHAANNAFPGFVEYEKLVGHLWRDGTGHGKFHPFDLKIHDYTHPITRGLGEVRQHQDELYHKLVNTQQAAHRTLATAFSSNESGGSGRDEPMILVGEYGKGRVFHTPLGHVWRKADETRASQNDPRFHRLMQRGCEWAATGDVQDHWVELFNGKDLTGFVPFLSDANVKAEDVWSVKDGVLVCKGRPAGYLRTKDDFKNYILTFEWRWDAADQGGRNSGCLVRMIGEDKVWPKSLEAQLQSGSAGDFWTIEEFPATTAAERKNGRNTKKTHENEKPIGEWNEYRITVDRGNVVLSVNGQILNEATEVLETAGKICWQSEGATIEFRNMRVLELP